MITILLMSCQNHSEKKETPVDSLKTSDSVLVENEKPLIDSLLKSDSLLKAKFPTLDSIFKKATFRDSVAIYCNHLFKKDIDNQEKIMALMSYRDSLKPILENFSYLLSESLFENMKKWEKYEKELIEIGFLPFYAEGMFSGLTNSPILQAQIKEFGTPEFQLMTDFENANGKSMGGEYPYLDLTANIEMVLIGEKMSKEFGETPEYKKIEQTYRYALKTLTDLHCLVQTDDTREYILHDISRDFWPNATDVSFMEQFVKKHKTSRFAPAIKKILVNVSELQASEDLEKGEVYLIAVESFKTEEEAENKVFELLNKSIDVPHVISSKKGKTEQYHAVYRFYAQEAKAKENLKKIKSQFKNAKIIHIDYNWNEL